MVSNLIIVLSHFNVIQGPKIVLQVPETSTINDIEQIPQLLNLYDEGFFIQIFPTFKSANLVFEIDSMYARGKREMLLISILVGENEGSVNLNFAQQLLESFVKEFKEIEYIYKGLYVNSQRFQGATEKFNEIRNLLFSFYKSVNSTIEALRNADIRYQALFKGARDAIIIIDRTSEKITEANNQAEKLFKRSRKELINLPVKQITFTEDNIRILEKIENQIKIENAPPFFTGIKIDGGNDILIEVSASEIEISGNVLIQCIIRDITEREGTKERLKESEEKYKALYDNALVGMLSTSLDGKPLAVNDLALSMLGYATKAEFMENYHASKHWVYPEERKKVIEKIKQNGIVSNVKEKYVNLEGREFWGETSIKLYPKEGRLDAVFIDITEREQLEESLKESEEKFRKIAEQSLVGIAIIQDNRVKYNNQKWANIFGYTVEELKNWKPGEFINAIHPDDRQIAIENARKKQLGLVDEEIYYQLRCIKKTGELIWVDSYGRTITYKGKSADLSILIDVTDKKVTERMLEASEQRYRSLIDGIYDIIIELDSNAKITYISPQAFDILGFTPEELINKNGLELVHKDDLSNLIEAMKVAIETGDVLTLSYRSLHKNGYYVPVFAKGSLIKNNGESKFVAVIRDISDEKEAEQFLKESEEKYRYLFESSPYMIILINNKGIILDINPMTFKYVNLTKEELIGKDFRQLNFIPNEDLHKLKVILQQLFQLGNCQPTEFKIKNPKDGHLTWLNFQASLIKLKDENLIQVIIQDITEKKEAELKLKASEEKYKVILDKANDIIVILNLKFELEFINEQRCFDLLGYSIEEIRGKNTLNFIHQEDVKRVIAAIENGIKNGQGTEEVRLRHKQGHYIWFDVKGRTIYNKEGDMQAIMIARDISERKQADLKLKESEEKYRLISENANDIFSILNDKFIIEYINEEPCIKIVGYTPKEVISKSVLQFVHPDDREKVIKDLKEGLKTRVGEEEIRFIHKKGQTLWLELRGKTFFDSQNKFKAIFVARDITAKKQAELKLKESEEKYRIILENVNDLIAILNLKVELEYINDQPCFNVLGYTSKELIGKVLLNLIHPEDNKMATSTLNNGFRDGTGSAEFRIQHKDGHYVWLDVKGTLIQDKDNNRKAIIIARDISEHKQADLKLKESEENYRLISENANDMISIFDGNFKMEYVNEVALKKILGYSKKEVLGKPGFRFMHPDDKEQYFKDGQKVFSEGESFSIARLRHKDGRYIWFEFNNKLTFDENKKPRFLSVLRNVNERIISEQKLREAEEKYRTIFNKNPDIIYLTDTEGIILDINQAMLDLSSFSSKDLLGKNSLSFFAGKNIEELKRIVDEIRAGKEKNHLKFSAKNALGEIKDYEITSIPLKEEGKVLKVLNFAHDTTDFNKAQLKLKESEKKYEGAYLYENFYKDLLAHDINNILQNIGISADLSKQYIGNRESLEKVNESLDVIREQYIRGKNLVSNVRKLSQIESKELPLKETDLLIVLKETINFIEQAFKRKNLNIQLHSNFSKLTIKVNDLLRDIFENIFNNAVKFNNNPVIDVNIYISKIQKDNIKYVKLEFIDNGIGIEDYRKEEIFQRAQIERKTTKGMGIGLSLVKKIVDSYNGEIWVEDRVKGDYAKGCNFVVVIPET